MQSAVAFGSLPNIPLTEGNEDNKGFQPFGHQDSVSFVIASLESSSLSPSILLPAFVSHTSGSLFTFCMFPRNASENFTKYINGCPEGQNNRRKSHHERFKH
jgi:hypothetical protein